MKTRCIEIEPLSIAWAVLRVLHEAEETKRLSETESAVIRDLISHTELPQGFLKSPGDRGGFAREERF